MKAVAQVQGRVPLCAPLEVSRATVHRWRVPFSVKPARPTPVWALNGAERQRIAEQPLLDTDADHRLILDPR